MSNESFPERCMAKHQNITKISLNSWDDSCKSLKIAQINVLWVGNDLCLINQPIQFLKIIFTENLKNYDIRSSFFIMKVIERYWWTFHECFIHQYFFLFFPSVQIFSNKKLKFIKTHKSHEKVKNIKTIQSETLKNGKKTRAKCTVTF